MTCTQPLCGPCWDLREPDRRQLRVLGTARERCCMCGHLTYIRVTPGAVSYPAKVQGAA